MREDRATTGYYCHRHEKNVRDYFCYDCEAEEINPSKYVKINDMEKSEYPDQMTSSKTQKSEPVYRQNGNILESKIRAEVNHGK